MAFGWGTNDAEREVTVETLEQRYADAGLSCDYYTPAVHKGAFALPGYILKLLP